MGYLKIHGQLLFGHQFVGDFHAPILQRTIIITGDGRQETFQQSELSPIVTVDQLASDPDFRSVFQSGQSPETADLGIAMVANNAVLELQKMHQTLIEQINNLSGFLRTLGHEVAQADAVIFMEHSKPDLPVIRVKAPKDLETLRNTVFSEQNIRQWIADAIARLGE